MTKWQRGMGTCKLWRLGGSCTPVGSPVLLEQPISSTAAGGAKRGGEGFTNGKEGHQKLWKPWETLPLAQTPALLLSGAGRSGILCQLCWFLAFVRRGKISFPPLSFRVLSWDPCNKSGFPGGAVVRICLQMLETQEKQFDPWVRKIPWSRKWQPIPVFLPGESHGQRNLAEYIAHGVTKSQTHAVIKETNKRKPHRVLLTDICHVCKGETQRGK